MQYITSSVTVNCLDGIILEVRVTKIFRIGERDTGNFRYIVLTKEGDILNSGSGSGYEDLTTVTILSQNAQRWADEAAFQLRRG